VEAEYLKPEVHSLMNINRPVLTAAELNRLILFVSEPAVGTRTTGPARA
jgi:hypothetical protein